jgi:hypothetical protein
MPGSPPRPRAQVRLHRVHRAFLSLLPLLLATAPLPAGAAVHQMFVTSVAGTGNLGSWPQAGGQTGLAAGDAICRSLATTAGLVHANLYRAWLSTSTTDAYCHVAGFPGQKANNCNQPTLPDAGPWERTDGASFSHHLSDLSTSFDVLHPPFVDENGSLVATGATTTFTGTDWGGNLLNATSDCNDWQSASASDHADVGGIEYGATGWTGRRLEMCNQSHRLYCFDPGTGSTLPSQGSAAGAWVFVTSAQGTGDLGSWPQAGGATGRAAGDAICRNLAAAAHLPAANSFVAWLSVTGAPAIDRILPDGPFRRIGGIQIAASKSDLLTVAPFHESDIETNEVRQHGNDLAFTGTGVDGQPTGDDCGGWTQSTPGPATVGEAASAGFDWTGEGGATCDFQFHLLCFSNVVILFADGFESGDTSQWSTVTP